MPKTPAPQIGSNDRSSPSAESESPDDIAVQRQPATTGKPQTTSQAMDGEGVIEAMAPNPSNEMVDESDDKARSGHSDGALAGDATGSRSDAFGGASQREDRIRAAAYELAERRGFEPGFETEDWLEAERQFDAAGQSRA